MENQSADIQMVSAYAFYKMAKIEFFHNAVDL